MKTIYFTLIALMITLTANAQLRQMNNAYYLQMVPGNKVGNKMEMIIQVASNSGAKKLGSCDLQFLIDTTLLSNPALTRNNMTAAYDLVNVTKPTSNKVSLNISLANRNTGMALASFPHFTEVARITFDISRAASTTIEWTDNIADTKETVFYFDDEDTLRHPVSMLNVADIYLPIELSAFEVNWNDDRQNNALITWSTANEKENAYFEIERSLDGVSGWEVIEVVASNGTASSYKVEDVNVGLKMTGEYVYYRIKDLSVAGEANVSDMKVLRRTRKTEATVSTYPNPFVAGFNVEFTAKDQESVSIKLYASNGQLVYNQEIVASSNNLVNISAKNLPAGVYVLTINTTNSNIVQQVIKL